MKNKNIGIMLISFGVFIILLANYHSFDGFTTKYFDSSEYGKVERVIDGDTLVINGSSYRLLGINCPEKGEKYHDEAKSYLEELVLNKSVKIVYGKDKTDKYSRYLAYFFDGETNINQKIVENGFANFYFPSGKDIYYNDFKQTWSSCIESGKNLCEKSDDKCANCIILNEFDIKNQKTIFENICNFDCDLTGWRIKDEGRKNFIFSGFILKSNKEVAVVVGNKTNTENELFWSGYDYVWTSTGDTLFLRDDSWKLVLWENY